MAAKKTRKPAKPVKAGTGKKAGADRRERFIAEYLTNGNNGTQAAIAAGYSARTAPQYAYTLLHHPEVAARVSQVAATVAEQAGLSVERWVKEMAAVGHYDPGELYDRDGLLIPIHRLPEHVRRAIASVKVNRTRVRGEDETTSVEESTVEIKAWDKNAALANIGKHLGMFSEDNQQRAEGIKVLIQLVG